MILWIVLWLLVGLIATAICIWAGYKRYGFIEKNEILFWPITVLLGPLFVLFILGLVGVKLYEELPKQLFKKAKP